MLKKVLGKITPSAAQMQKEQEFAKAIISRIMAIAGKHTRAMLVGSIARNTHLAGDTDLDIFVFFPKSLPREEFEKEGLRIGKLIFRGHKWEKAYSEHPYIRGEIGGHEVEIVPTYDVTDASEMKSAVDRSALHNKYLLSKMIPGQEQEVRLLKQFMKGVKCYGADLSTNSFPGYVAELLALKYRTFTGVLEAAAEWKRGQVIDIEGHLSEQDAAAKFNSHLIVVDPVDRGRNVAAALSENQYARFIAAARQFLKKPSINFFFPKKHEAWNSSKLKGFLRKTELVAILSGYPAGIVEDVMWGQLRRLSRKIATAVEMQGFALERHSRWLEHRKQICIVLEVESTQLPAAKIVAGPPVIDEANSHAFLSAHFRPLSGPRIENGRWVIEIERKYTRLDGFLEHYLKALKREERGAIRSALRRKAKVISEKEIIALYRKNKDFQQFLTAYLKGKEEFLDY
ncbi:MAG TPA: CCA tRNA nucleotidyltransferase [Candidatus Diapherotrites archaeon]|uniref:CCA-adding enzyme n=1 Tax=Candidatus Iainarchaeum sp. TaxID=3101447 RepID=A0A7J4IWT2_9ARCH|nr:CCA tRNA nucleotidyltransferase [Candidatus Diapherotrites archaeon]